MIMKEHDVLLVIKQLDKEAYGFNIKTKLQSRLDKNISIIDIYQILDKLEEKGLILSYYGESTPDRSGKRKKYFKLNSYLTA